MRKLHFRLSQPARDERERLCPLALIYSTNDRFLAQKKNREKKKLYTTLIRAESNFTAATKKDRFASLSTLRFTCLILCSLTAFVQPGVLCACIIASDDELRETRLGELAVSFNSSTAAQFQAAELGRANSPTRSVSCTKSRTPASRTHNFLLRALCDLQ